MTLHAPRRNLSDKKTLENGHSTVPVYYAAHLLNLIQYFKLDKK